MADNPRLDDLRRRVQKDPASIAFAQLAEELRRSGALQEAVDVSLAGLAIHPSYLSARVTLGRALLELDRLDQAQTELERVLAGAPENLAARRGLGEIFSRRGAVDEALVHYRAALALAPNDPDLEENVTALSRRHESGSVVVEHRTTNSPAEEPGAALPVGNVPSRQAGEAPSSVTSSALEPADEARDHDRGTVVALEGWLDAIHVSRAHRRA
jgi:tetratricopeptide (TPR) repeat protein